MAFNEVQMKKIELLMNEYIKRKRPPENIRKELDISYRIENQNIYIYETRPQWDNNKIIRNFDIAKATYVATKKVWNILWMRSDLKWHMYGPAPTVSKLEEFLDIVEKDEYCCFWG